MSLRIKAFTLGIVDTNAYLLGDEETRDAVLIDPVDEADTLFQGAQAEGWTIRLILATHAHFDHVLASSPLKALTGAPFALHADAAATLPSMPELGLMFTGRRFPDAAAPDQLLTSESQTIRAGSITLETRYTPGHAPGHLAFYLRNAGVVFSGDALFAGSIGRTDLPGGDQDVLLDSITHQLLPLGDHVHVLSGHGEPTTIGRERRTNPFLQF